MSYARKPLGHGGKYKYECCAIPHFNGKCSEETTSCEAWAYTRPVLIHLEPFLVAAATTSVLFSTQSEQFLPMTPPNIAHRQFRKCPCEAEMWTRVREAHKEMLTFNWKVDECKTLLPGPRGRVVQSDPRMTLG